MPCCKAENYLWCRDLPVVYKDIEGRVYCIFHAPYKIKTGEKEIPVEEFNNLVFERIKEVKDKGKSCDLSGTVLEGDISFDEFNEDNPLPEISFYEAIFSGNADFSETVFNGQVGFLGTTFSKAAFFQRAAFSKNAVFSEVIETTHTEETSFSKTMLTTFSERADFSGAIFSKEANFFEATFSKEADFLGAIFKDAYFTKATFSGETNFLGLSVDGKIRFEGVNFKKVSFLDTDLRKIDFINCDWPKKGGRNVLYDEIELFKKEKGKDFKDKIKKVEILYRQLKQKYKEEHNEPEVSNWHYGEKEMQRKQSSMKDFSFYLLHPYWLSSGYGEKPARAGIFLIFLLLYTSLFLAVAGLVVPDNVKDVHGITSVGWPYDIDIKKTWALFLNTFKYVTFQRDPFFEPANWYGEAIKLLAQILIPLQAALFALAVRNRFRR